MPSPEDWGRRVLATYSEAEAELLRIVARRAARGLDSPSWAEDKLRELQAVRRELGTRLAVLEAEGTALTAEAVRDAFTEAAEAGASELTQMGLEPRFVGASEGAVSALEAEASGLASGLVARPVTNAALRLTSDAYRTVIAETSNMTSAGALTRREAAQRALWRFADQGIKGFVDAAGRRWEMSTYAEMATRTSTLRAAVEGRLDSLDRFGIGLCIVPNIPEECQLCRPWEGRVLRRSSAVEVPAKWANAPTVDDARSAGLFHANCRHTLGAYIPGETKAREATADPRGQAERERHRELERRIRRWKRRQATAIDEAHLNEATVGLRNAQAELRSFLDEAGRLRQRAREQLGAR